MIWDWWLLLPAAVGFAMGLLYALSGFWDSGKPGALKKNPRVTNLIWMLTGGLTAVLGDWFKFGGDFPISQRTLTGVYVVSAIGTAFIAIVVIAGSIYRDRMRTLSQTGSVGRLSPTQIALLYVQRGYPAYAEELEHERTLRENVLRAAETRRLQLQSSADLSNEIAAQIAACSAVHDAPPRFRQLTIDTLLEAMMSVVIQHTALRNEDFAINFMEALPFADGYQRYQTITRFVFDPPASYSHLLVLRRYLGLGGGDDFALPVHAQGPAARPLPGAPSVLFFGNPRYVQTNRINADYGKALQLSERAQIIKYLEDQSFCCFLSLPIQWGGTRLGVVNVDSKHEAFGIDDNPAGHFANTLLPFCMLLGNVMSGGQPRPGQDG
jgi:hypothetical protein